MSEFHVLTGDCIESMRDLPDASVDAVVTDPPYELGFMGKSWDDSGIANSVEMWSEVNRVLRPGGYLVAFGGTRTYHRMACAVEDAGFEIRDQLAWIYGSGFPKSRNLDGDREGWGTALKPAQEPIVLARKPLVGTVAANVLEHGTGALNIDGCRIEGTKGDGNWAGSTAARGYEGGWDGEAKPNAEQHPSGRWPANVLLDEVAAAAVDDQSGISSSRFRNATARKRNNGIGLGNLDSREGSSNAPDDYGDAGGASRFFYCAKTSTGERNAGLDSFTRVNTQPYNERPSGGLNAHLHGADPKPRANVHPTVKPIDLMRWLVRLITPPSGTVLDPFTGSGTTGCAAVLEDFNFIGCEREPEYVEIATARIEWWDANREGGQTDVILQAAAKRDKAINPEQIGLWGAA